MIDPTCVGQVNGLSCYSLVRIAGDTQNIHFVLNVSVCVCVACSLILLLRCLCLTLSSVSLLVRFILALFC